MAIHFTVLMIVMLVALIIVQIVDIWSTLLSRMNWNIYAIHVIILLTDSDSMQ